MSVDSKEVCFDSSLGKVNTLVEEAPVEESTKENKPHPTSPANKSVKSVLKDEGNEAGSVSSRRSSSSRKPPLSPKVSKGFEVNGVSVDPLVRTSSRSVDNEPWSLWQSSRTKSKDGSVSSRPSPLGHSLKENLSNQIEVSLNSGVRDGVNDAVPVSETPRRSSGRPPRIPSTPVLNGRHRVYDNSASSRKENQPRTTSFVKSLFDDDDASTEQDQNKPNKSSKENKKLLASPAETSLKPGPRDDVNDAVSVSEEVDGVRVDDSAASSQMILSSDAIEVVLSECVSLDEFLSYQPPCIPAGTTAYNSSCFSVNPDDASTTSSRPKIEDMPAVHERQLSILSHETSSYDTRDYVEDALSEMTKKISNLGECFDIDNTPSALPLAKVEVSFNLDETTASRPKIEVIPGVHESGPSTPSREVLNCEVEVELGDFLLTSQPVPAEMSESSQTTRNFSNINVSHHVSDNVSMTGSSIRPEPEIEVVLGQALSHTVKYQSPSHLTARKTQWL